MNPMSRQENKTQVRTYQSPLPFLLQAWEKQGDVIFLEQTGKPGAILLCHPDHLKHVLQNHHRNYTRSQLLQPAAPLLGNGLVTSTGSLWYQQRRLMQPAFHRQQLTALVATMVDVIEARLEHWRAAAMPFDIAAEMKHLTMQIVVAALFGFELGEATETIGRAFHEVVAQLRQRLQTRTTAHTKMEKETFQTALSQLDTIVYEIIAHRRRESREFCDLLTMLLAARDEESHEGMNDQQLRDEVMTLFVSGHETTTDGLTWMWYLLTQHPEVAEKLYQEIDETLRGRVPTFTDLPLLPYSMQVIQETLRFYPPVPLFGRTPLTPDEIDGYTIPALTQIILCPYITHRHPAFWSHPTQFDPERFTPEQSKHRSRYAYLPFGGGPHQCIGNHFALLMIQLTLILVIQKYKLSLMPGQTVVPQPTSTFVPGQGVFMSLETRYEHTRNR